MRVAIYARVSTKDAGQDVTNVSFPQDCMTSRARNW